MVVPAQVAKCPGCGYVFQTEPGKMEIDKEAKLSEVDTSFAFKTNYIITKKLEDLATPQELKEYAEAKGYKKGWIYYQMKARGWLTK